LSNQTPYVIRSSIGESSIKKTSVNLFYFRTNLVMETEERHYPTQRLMLKKLENIGDRVKILFQKFKVKLVYSRYKSADV
jgi:hypothetical protein